MPCLCHPGSVSCSLFPRDRLGRITLPPLGPDHNPRIPAPTPAHLRVRASQSPPNKRRRLEGDSEEEGGRLIPTNDPPARPIKVRAPRPIRFAIQALQRYGVQVNADRLAIID
ncbi:hypothetical protein CC2G_014122 [Coprinopsis cinerea AmutBmut pab1-1]|nr:hypothetical protein CC2G_014122 [Coprinopsis cinerea AmutBmut pab1-1]